MNIKPVVNIAKKELGLTLLRLLRKVCKSTPEKGERKKNL